MTDAPTTDLIARALKRHRGRDVDVVRVEALSAGAASDTFAVETVYRSGRWPLILQRAASQVPLDGQLTKRTLSMLQDRLGAAGLNVAPVVCALSPEDGLGEGFIMERIDGESLATRYLREAAYDAARAALTTQCAEALAQLHALPTDMLDGLDVPAYPPRVLIDRLDSSYQQSDFALPVFDLMLGWLRRHKPVAGTMAIVHGDFRSGNFIVGPEGLRAVLDWELAHIGDPMEDLGWLCVNSWRFGHWRKPVGGFGDREPFYRSYEAASGRTVDRKAMPFWEILGTLRWGVACLQLARQHLTGASASIERAAIGRRVSEVEIDLLHLMKYGTV